MIKEFTIWYISFLSIWKKETTYVFALKLCSVIFLLFFSSQLFSQSNGFFRVQQQAQSWGTSEKTNPSTFADISSVQPFAIVDEVEVNNQNFVGSSPMGSTKVTLEQVRNGTGASPTDPGAWASGNLNGSQAHYAEKWSIPYRLTFTNLSTGSHTVVIEWDVKQGGKNALDYITHYNSIDNPSGSHLSTFNHSPENIDPTIGFSGLGSVSETTIDPPPGTTASASFISLPASLKKMSIWGGTISSLTYGPAANLTLDAAQQQLTIVFNASSSTAVISWGGHIASIADWGAGNSASSISGSPYHTRLISFDGGGGNQDRSLSADAVIDPPTCNISGPSSAVTCNTTSTFTNQNPVPTGYTFTWSLTNNTSDAFIVGADQDGTKSGTNPITVNSGNSACNKSYTVNLTIYKNGAQVGAPCTYPVTVNDNIAPSIGNAGANTTVECTASPSFTPPTASDACSSASVVEISNVTAAGACGNSYSRTITWLAVDACGNSSGTRSQTISYVDTQAPTIGNAGNNQTVECTASPSFTPPTASDVCNTYNVVEVSNTTAAGSCGNSYSRTKVWRAVDACGNSSDTRSQTITYVDTQAPIIGNAGNNQTVECTASPSFTPPTASDVCNTYNVVEVSNTTAVGSCGTNYSRTKVWRAVDACGNSSATRSQTITYVDTQAPTIGNAGNNQTVECTASPSFTPPTASDICNTYEVVEVSNTTAAGSCGNNYSRTKVWRAVDACGNSSDTRSQTITYVDTQAPSIGSAGDNATIECTATPSFTAPTASDVCNSVSVQVVSDITTPGSCANNYTRTVTWQAVDACGNSSATRSQTITVVDNTAPTFTNCPPDVTLECLSDVPVPPDVTATDNCSGATVSFVEQQSNPGDGCNNVITRTWTATDACGNTNTCVQLITIKVPPVIECPPNVTLECEASTLPANTGTAKGYSPCSATAITYTDADGSSNDCGGYNIVRTWKATDGGGNTSTCVQTISFVSGVITKANTNTNGLLSTGRTGSGSAEVESSVTVKAMPNPFSSQVKFMITTPKAGKGTLDLYNISGQKVKTVFQGYIPAGVNYFDLRMGSQQKAELIYILKIGEQKVSGKLLQLGSQ